MRKIPNKTPKMLQIQTEWGVALEEILRKKYVDENKLTESIANELQISYATAVKWLNLAGIYSRRLHI